MARADVVVVGAGTSGSVVAARLAEDPHRSVLLLEAGPDRSAYHGLDPFVAMAEPGRVWDGLVAVHTAAQGPQPYWQGRGVGGSSAVNGMVATWPGPADFDRWAVAGWSGTDLAPAMARVEAVLTLQPAPTSGPLCAGFAAAAVAAGLDVEHPCFTADATRRVSVADAYLGAHGGRPNLTVRTGAVVDRLLLDGRRAAGVHLAGGDEVEAGEVVLSAGAIHSPALLLAAGVDRPGLGGGLQDHPAVRVGVELARPGRVPDRERLPFSVLVRRGAVQLLPMDFTGSVSSGGVVVALMDARSRGSVTVAGGEPVVRFEQLADERDRAALDAGVTLAVRLLEHHGLRRVVAAVERPALDDLGDVYHAAGTCRMGAPDDDDAVVDLSLRVIGYEGLRVVDASVLPRLPPANPMLTCAMIGERAIERW